MTDVEGERGAKLRELCYMNRFTMDSRVGQSNILHMSAENESMMRRKLKAQLGIQHGSSSEIFGEQDPAGLGGNKPCRKSHAGI